MPGADRPRDRLHRSVEPGLEIEDPERSVLILHLGDAVAAVGRGLEGVRHGLTRDSRHRGQEFGFLRPAHIVDEIPVGEARPVELVLVGRGIVGDVHVMVAGVLDHAALFRAVGDFSNQSLLRVAAQEFVHVVDVGLGSRGSSKQQDPAVRVLIREEIVESARRVRRPDPAHLFHLAGIRQAGDIENDRAEIAIGTPGTVLNAQGHVIAPFQLEVPWIKCTRDAGPELGIFDLPLVHHPCPFRILHADDVEAVVVYEMGDVNVRSRQLLFDVDVEKFLIAALVRPAGDRQVREDVDVGARLLAGCPLGQHPTLSREGED